jgi:hypothetical protein
MLSTPRAVFAKNHIWHELNWSIFGPSLGALVMGLILLGLPIDESTKFFICGALIGVGAGGAVAEISAASERFEQRVEIRQLSDPILSQCRLAFRIAEFSFPAAQAISEKRLDAREVRQVLFLGELLGIKSTLEDFISDTDPNDPALCDDFIDKITEATLYVGGPLFIFFRLGFDIVAMRAPGITAVPDHERALLAKRTEQNLSKISAFTDDTDVAKAWENFTVLWNRHVLAPEEIHELLVTFYGFFLVLGHDAAGFLTLKLMIDGLARLKIGRRGRPVRLTQVFDAIRDWNAPVKFDPVTGGTAS